MSQGWKGRRMRPLSQALMGAALIHLCFRRPHGPEGPQLQDPAKEAERSSEIMACTRTTPLTGAHGQECQMHSPGAVTGNQVILMCRTTISP